MAACYPAVERKLVPKYQADKNQKLTHLIQQSCNMVLLNTSLSVILVEFGQFELYDWPMVSQGKASLFV